MDLVLPNRVVVTVENIVVNGPTDVDVTIVPKRSTGNIDSANIFSDGTLLMVGGNSHPEGSAAPAAHVSQLLRDENELKTIRRTHRITGTAKNQRKFWEGDSMGRRVRGEFDKGTLDAQYEFSVDMSNALLFDERIDNNTLKNSVNANPEGLNFTSTEGLLPYIERTGHVVESDPGQWSIATFDEAERILTRESNSSPILAMAGLAKNIENTKALVDFFNNGSYESVKKYGDEKLFAKDSGFIASADIHCFEKSGRKYYFMRQPSFDHPRIGGVDGYDYTDYCVMLPIGKKKAKSPDGSSVMLPTFGVRYLDYIDSRKVKTWSEAGVNGKDVESMYMLSEFGAQHIGGNNMIVFRPR